MNPARNDSSLITVEYFNTTTGKRQKIDIYDSLGIKDSYRYTYLHDTLVETMSFVRRDTAIYHVTHFYDALGKILTWEQTGDHPAWSNSKGENKYDKKGQLVEMKSIGKDGKTTRHEKYKYHANGVRKEKKVLLPKPQEEKLRYDEKGKHLRTAESKTFFATETFENHKGLGRKMTRETMGYSYSKQMVSLKSWHLLKARSVMVTECYYRQDGLPDYEIQYLNDRFFAKKVYKYIAKP